MDEPTRATPLHGLALAGATAAVSVAAFMNVLDTTIAVVALPTIAGNLAATPSQASWVVTSYGVCLAVVLPLSGWISRRYGLVRTFLCAVLLFTLTSWLCASANTFNLLLFFRALQGFAGGLLLPLSQSLLLRIYPPEKHGTALGIWAVSTAIAPVAGPLLGGYITDVWGWPWIFYVNVPFGLFSAYLCWTLMSAHESERVREPVDLVGLFLLATGVICFQLVLDRGHELDWFASPQISVMLTVSVMFFFLFIVWERDAPHPIVDLSLFRYTNFVTGTALISVFYAVFVVVAVVYPIWIQTVLGYSARWSGIVMSPTSIVPLIAMPLCRTIRRTADPRPLVTIGCIGITGSMLLHAHTTTDAPSSYLALARFTIGMGMPLVWMPLMMNALTGLPPDKINTATGLFNFSRMLLSSLGTAAAVTLWDERSIFHRARLVEEVSRDTPERRAIFDSMTNTLQDPQAALAALESIITRQARTLGQQDLFYVCAGAVLLVGAGCWLLSGRLASSTTTPVPHD
ncbi:MAG: DHA2 family efflux MFS transporter permease subunit [Gammaproteobacteria bacterium]|nr:DHA2 family efflux MFS transporter permease subunit [Gammaproteobacteria bacterium]